MKLYEKERELSNSLCPHSRAVRLFPKMKELSLEISKYGVQNEELRLLYAEYCDQSAELIRVLATEVTRLRAAIGHFKYGWMDRAELIKYPDKWNDDVKKGDFE